jgi:hypothetical protein
MLILLNTMFHVNSSLSYSANPFYGMLVSTRTYTTDTVGEPKYLIAGKELTISEVRGMNPLDRTIAHWALLVDWDLHRQRPYVIVDPYDPEGLLYLSRSEYLAQVKVCASNDMLVLVVARPGSKAPLPSSQNSPPHESTGVSPEASADGGERFDSRIYFSKRGNRLTWREFLKLRAFVSRNVKTEDGMVTASSDTMARITLLWSRQLLHYVGVSTPERRLQGMEPFAKLLARVVASNGIGFCSKRLKVAMFAVYSYLSGNPLQSTDALGHRIRLSHGLPTMIPAPYRNLIRENNLDWIRVWLSVLNIYRSFKVETPDPETAYLTIRKPHPDLSQEPLFERWQYFCKEIFPQILATQTKTGKVPLYRYASNIGLIVRSAAVNLRGTSSLLGLNLDAQAWTSQSENLPLKWFQLHGDTALSTFMEKISKEEHWGKLADEDKPLDQPHLMYSNADLREDIVSDCWKTPEGPDKAKLARCQTYAGSAGSLVGHAFDARKLAWESKSWAPQDLLTGRLFNFDAPGGKLRTVAICDYWSQVAMKSVHDHLFHILKELHLNDATFDQNGFVERYHVMGYKPHWSFDLSAATDSIPLGLYIECLTPFLRQEGETYDDARKRAELWSKIMTCREFGVPEPKKGQINYTGSRKYPRIQYNTGQPMGAYSSWASMALVHHAMVQFAAWLNKTPGVTEGKGPRQNKAEWFESYGVLGDDVDIAKCETTARNYQVACAAFGIKIGLAKSLRSKGNFFEFANQRFAEEGNISPLSFMEELTSSTSWNRRVEYANRISTRFGKTSNELNLVRLVCTARQWTLLIPELTGYRPKIIMRLLKFILLNPLKSAWHSTSVINIEAIKEWIGNLKEVVLSVASSKSAWVTLEGRLAEELATLVKTETKRLVERIPTSHTRYAYDPEVENFLASIGEKHRANMPFLQPRLRSVGPNTKYSWTYIEFSINKFNEDLRKRIRQFEMTNWRMLTLKPYLVHQAPDGSEDFNKTLALHSSVAHWVKLWLDLGNFPKPIIINNDGLSASLRVESSQSDLVEHAETLLKVILPLIAEHLGHNIAGVPYYPLKGAKGGAWYLLMKRCLSKFTKACKAAASDPNPFGLRTRKDDGSFMYLCPALHLQHGVNAVELKPKMETIPSNNWERILKGMGDAAS